MTDSNSPTTTVPIQDSRVVPLGLNKMFRRRWAVTALVVVSAVCTGWRWWTAPQIDPRVVGGWEELVVEPDKSLPEYLRFQADGTYEYRIHRGSSAPNHPNFAMRSTWRVRNSVLERRIQKWRLPHWQNPTAKNPLIAWTTHFWRWATEPSGPPLSQEQIFQYTIVSVTADQLVLRVLKRDGAHAELAKTYRRVADADSD